MAETNLYRSPSAEVQTSDSQSEPCVMVIFGASGDVTKRLVVPALYNLLCDGLLNKNFAILGTGRTAMNDDEFRSRMAGEDGLKAFHTRKEFDEAAAKELLSRMYFQTGDVNVEDFKKLKERVSELDRKHQAGGNVLFYFAVAPKLFGPLCDTLYEAGFNEGPGWRRIIVEKPFGTDLASARALNKEILAHWREDQIYRIDHYLGKETVQNLLAFRFSNGIFEPLWNREHIDNIQFNVCETVDVQGRGGYYDHSGVLRDMMQNHMFQMLAYLCMEPPASFTSEAIRNEKSKLLESVRVYSRDEVAANAVRGQYGPASGKPGYRQEKDVDPKSSTETFAALKLHVDNWRWQGVPIYLRSGKALWKRGTEIVVEFKKAPQAIFRGSTVDELEPNRLVFHIQPFQGIELIFQAKVPGPTLQLQEVDMRFSYGDAFRASRYTGYEVMLYSATRGDATLFSRGDLVDAAWRIAQPVLDYWESTPAGNSFPNYVRGTWGPPDASHFIERDGRSWFEVVTPEVLEKLPLFKGADPLLLNRVIMALRPTSVDAGETIVKEGDMSDAMYLILRGQVDIKDRTGKVIQTLGDGEYFGEIGLLMATPRTATVAARTQCDLFVLNRSEFSKILRDHHQLAETVTKVAKERYNLIVSSAQLTES